MGSSYSSKKFSHGNHNNIFVHFRMSITEDSNRGNRT